MNALILANEYVGAAITQWLIENYRDDIGLVVAISESDIRDMCLSANVPCVVYENDASLLTLLAQREVFDWGFLLWWPHIIGDPLIRVPRHGFVNTHPSLLPHNRGKHYNFWALVEEAPFGVTLHMVEKGIDSGDIVAQMPIDYDWEDTGESLYNKALKAMPELFKRIYPDLREGRLTRVTQDPTKGSFHTSKELEAACRINLDATYRARDLLNLIRARTFKGHPACRFSEPDGEEFEVRLTIRRKSH